MVPCSWFLLLLSYLGMMVSDGSLFLVPSPPHSPPLFITMRLKKYELVLVGNVQFIPINEVLLFKSADLM